VSSNYFIISINCCCCGYLGQQRLGTTKHQLAIATTALLALAPFATAAAAAASEYF